MRSVEIVDKLKLRFPGRDESFIEGVEIGLLAALMANDLPCFTREIGAGTLEQARAVADKLGYQLVVQSERAGCVVVSATKYGRRPKLRLVRSS